MKLRIHFTITTVIIALALSLPLLPVALLASSSSLGEKTFARPLIEVLDEFGERYQVFFSYEAALLEEIQVEFEFRMEESLDEAIVRLMAETGLKYDTFSNKYFVIYEETRVAKRDAKKVIKKLEQIEKLHQKGNFKVRPSSNQAGTQLSKVVDAVVSLKKEQKFVKSKKKLSGGVQGVITDILTGRPLAFATVQVKGTSLGEATDLEGEYRITGIPAGPQTLLFSYLGYQPDSINITIIDGQILQQDFAMSTVAFIGEEVIITAQREGQAAAINQQVNSNSIVNVVSSERIQELPDENAAESVGRLPGISVRRSGGEGQRVNIRGLSPKFSAVAVDGVRIPATGQGRRVFNLYVGQGQGSSSPNVDDRSVDLSMISSEALAGIEVYKSMTPDQDGDAIGGRVNFITAKAPKGTKYMVNVLGGANHYHQTYGNFKSNAVFSKRFANDKLGLIASGGYSSIDRSSDNDNVDYVWLGEVVLQGLTLTDNKTDRKRYNGNLTLDYDLGDHEFVLSGMYARTDVENFNRTLRINSRTNSGNWSAGHSKSNINLINSSLGGKHLFNALDVDWKVTYIATIDENPYSYGFGFNDNNPLTNNEIPRTDPYLTAEYTRFDPLEAAGGQPGGGAINRREDKNIIAQLNLQQDYKLGLNVSGFLKGGGKLSVKERFRERTNGTMMQGGAWVNAFRADNPEAIFVRGGPAAANFLDERYDPGNFFDGVYPFPIRLDAEAPKRLFDQYEYLRFDNIIPGTGDYDVSEKIYAGYVMTDVKIGKRLNLIGGVRYEHSDNNYTAYVLNNYSETIVGDGVSTVGTIEQRSSAQNYGEWLPMVNMRFNILQNQDNSNGLDLRLAATRAITRPDFYNLTPFISIRTAGGVIERSEPTLLPTTAWNYDAFLTFFNNKFGLMTVGAFYKELDNIDFIYGRDVEKDIVIDRFGEEFGLSDGFTIIEPLNATETTTVKGVEVELQTNLSFLPSPFDGIVLYGNYSRIFSEAKYPQRIAFFDFETFTTTLYDSLRTAGMPGQSRDIANASLGYDKGKFSGRLSWSFQGSALDFIGANELLDGYIDDYSRIDISLKFKLSNTISILANVTNLTNRYDRTIFGVERLPGASSIYGTTSWIGIRYSGSEGR